MIPVSVRVALKEKSKELGGLEALGRLLGCTKSHMSKIINGNTDISMDLARSINRHLGIVVIESRRA